MQNRQNYLWNHMLRRYEIYVVDLSNVLQFDIPLSKLLRCKILAVALVSNIMILTKDASQIAS